MPYTPRPEDERIRHKYRTHTSWDALVAAYARLPITRVRQLCAYDYLILRRDAVIDRLGRTESGIEYLNDAWMREQTEPDLDALWAQFGGG